MSEIGTGDGTDYPATLDTNNALEQNSNQSSPTLNRAEVVNDLASAIVAIQTELGLNPAGSFSTVVARLDALLAPVSFKNFTAADVGAAGVSYLGGFYFAPAADANLTQASATVNLGTANISYAAHAFLVASGAGAASGGTGSAKITVSGTSITDDGTRTGGDSEIIVADVTAMSTDQYVETTKKWLGTVVYTIAATIDHTTFNFDFNYGLAKYEDMANNDFTITSFECVGFGGASDSGFDVALCYHSASGWTYSAAAFVASPTVVTRLTDVHSTERQVGNNEPFAFKKTGLSQAVSGSGSEGIVIEITTATNNALSYMDAHLGVTFN